MMQAISVLGSTGSIGRQTLDVRRQAGGPAAVCLAAGQNRGPDGGRSAGSFTPDACRDGRPGRPPRP